MKRTLTSILAATLLLIGMRSEAQDNVAYQDSQVRFTVITDGVIRLEWHSIFL